MIIYAGVHGYLDDIAVSDVSIFEEKLFEALDSIYADFVRLLEKEQSLTEEVKSELDKLLTEFKQKN